MNSLTKKCCLAFACALVHPLLSYAQESVKLDGQDEAYQQSAKPVLLGNYQNNTIFIAGKSVKNLRGGQLLSSSKNITTMDVSPTGNSFAIAKEKESFLYVYDLWNKNKKLGTIKMKSPVTNCCYTADGVRLIVADSEGLLGFFRLSDFKQVEATSLPFSPSRLTVSGDGSLLAAANDNKVIVIGMDDKTERASLSAGGRITALSFSNDSKDLAILSDDGQMSVYDTNTFSVKNNLKSLGEGRDCVFHPNSKYISVITGDSRISIVNLMDEADRMYVEASEGGITDVLFAKDGRGGLYMVYNTSTAVHYKQMNELPPYLTKMLDDEVQALMTEWEKQMPDETDEEYQMRVNDETRANQLRMFEEEVATRMASDLGSDTNMTFGDYNPETNMMSLDFADMPPIYIDVPKEDLRYFMNADDIEIRNPIYGIGENDKFELVYADIYNKNTGKTYVFDNRNHELDYLAEDSGFMPLEVAQKGVMEEMKLGEMTESELASAKDDQKLSDYTKISVSTNTFTETDTDGIRHMNYKVSFGYTVEGGFSERDDFAPGRYKAEQSAAAQTMLNIIKKAMTTDFAEYVKEGKRVKIVITGSADASPIKRALHYAGEYGDYQDAPVVAANGQQTISVSKASGIATNEQLAFLRAMGMKHSMAKSVNSLKKMDCQYETHIEQAQEVGGKYRRILVDYIFEDAF